MRRKRPPPPDYQLSVDKIAGSIRDPVRRLRFLRDTGPQVVAPPVERGPARFLGLPFPTNPLIRLALVAIGGVVAGTLAISLSTATHAAALTIPMQPVRLAAPMEKPVPDVWLVDRAGSQEVYSNGLRIDDRYVVDHTPRSYVAYPATSNGQPVTRKSPAGIVFHTTESYQAPFEARQNDRLRRIGESLLDYVRRKFAYHFLIDRFGRVYRVVAESDAADHAGQSVWADDHWLYVNLNASFLAISFEARTEPGQTESSASPAQIHAAAVLTEMLRSRYHIAAANCVTHAQVSVNATNMQAGYHTDWASGFPFEQVGLPDNYAEPLPAVWAFGFEASTEFRNVTGVRMAEGVTLAERALQAGARAERCSRRAYIKKLQTAYRRRLNALRREAPEDPDDIE